HRVHYSACSCTIDALIILATAPPSPQIYPLSLHDALPISVFDDGTTGPKGVADEVEKKAKQLGAQPIRYVIRSGDKDFRAILATDRKSTRLNSSHEWISYAVFCLKKKKEQDK